MYNLTCNECGYKWESKKPQPSRCPGCRSNNWFKPINKYNCLRCSHTWTSRKVEPPGMCPKCQSYSWDVTRKGKE